MVLTGPGRPLSRFVKNVVVSIPDIAWVAPLPSPSMARSHGLLQPALGQLSTSDNLAGALAGIPAPGMGDTGETRQVLVVGASDEAAGIRDLIQVYVGRRCLNLARLHVAALATSSLHGVGRQSAAPSDRHRGHQANLPHCRMALALLSIPMQGLRGRRVFQRHANSRSEATLAPLGCLFDSASVKWIPGIPVGAPGSFPLCAPGPMALERESLVQNRVGQHRELHPAGAVSRPCTGRG